MYKKSPYYHNTHALNHREEYTTLTPELLDLLDLLEDEEDIFEIGFGLGERLYVFKNKELDIVGGVEFDPYFGTFGNKHFAVYDNHKIILTSLADWFNSKHKTYYTYYFLDNFNDELKAIMLNKIINTAEENGSKVFFIEKDEIPNTTKERKVQIYVANNGSKINDRESFDSELQSKESEQSSDSNES